MSEKTRVPAIPAPTDSNLRDVARAIKGVIDVREGLAGDPLDRVVTFRDMVNGGLAETAGSASSSSGLSLIPVGTETGGYDPTQDLTVPPAPSGFRVSSLFASIKLEWDAPQIKNYAYTEVWRLDQNILGQAVLIGSTPGTSYSDYIGGSGGYYYWIRFVSQAGVAGPFNDTNGTYAETAADPTLLLELLTGEITESQLYADLGSRIDLIDGPSSLPNSVANRILAEALARGAAITEESQIRQTADESLAQSITTITAAVEQNAAAIQKESIARADAISAEAIERETLAARVATTEDGVSANAAAIESESLARATADSAISRTITTLDSKVAENTSLIQQEAVTRANADSVNASLVSQVQARLNTGDFAAVKTQSSVSAGKITGLEAQYTVKIDVNGHVSGFGLATTTNTGTPRSAFIVRADRFAIAGPNDPEDSLGTLDPSRLPFVVTTSPTTINGVTVPAGAYLDTAFIGKATITKAQIGSVFADTIDAGYTNSVDLESSTFYGSELYLGGVATYEFSDPSDRSRRTGIASVASPNIALKRTGAEFDVNYFKIKNGASLITPFEVVGNEVRITSAAIGTGTITSANIADVIQSTNYVQGVSGWKIAKDGSAELGAPSIRGKVTASQIDSRGLSIQDQNGNVILAAGVPLSSSNVSGLGSFATLSRITGSNASTYIQNAAIDTLQIAGEAVTVPAVANAYSLVNVDRWTDPLNNWQTVVSLSVDFGDVAPNGVLVCGNVNILSQPGINFTATYMLLRNNTTGDETVAVGVAHGDSVVLSNFGLLSSTAGVNNFSLRISQEDTGGDYWFAASRSISVVGAKR